MPVVFESGEYSSRRPCLLRLLPEAGLLDDKIKVTDKRMFDSSGELREEYRQTDVSGGADESAAESVGEERSRRVFETEPEPAAQEPAAPERPGERERGHSAGTGQLGEPAFMDLIDLLAQPIVMFLGDAPLPDGSSAKNLGLARYHIDLLELVATKTKGNLAPQEERLLADLLYEFRMRYVEKAG